MRPQVELSITTPQILQPAGVMLGALPGAVGQPRALTEADAVDIWIARWLRIRRRDLLDRYGCDPRRLYEIWAEERFSGARAKAIKLFQERHPGLIDRIDYGRHTRISRTIHPDQLSLFE